MDIRDYESIVVVNRYMNILAVLLLLAFMIWQMNNLSTRAYYFLAAAVAYMGFVVAKSCFADRRYFERLRSEEGGAAGRFLSRVKTAAAVVRGKPEVASTTAGGARDQ